MSDEAGTPLEIPGEPPIEVPATEAAPAETEATEAEASEAPAAEVEAPVAAAQPSRTRSWRTR